MTAVATEANAPQSGEVAEGRPKNRIGRYHLVQKLGSGQMGNVYRARQWGLERDVVIKVLPKHLQEDSDYLDQFYRQAKAAGKLQHVNIVKAIDVGQSETGYHYFVMEYIIGRNVRELLEYVNAFEERRAVDILLQVTRALAHAHLQGICHGDVQPEYMQITESEVVKLAGLGLAKDLVDHSPHRTRTQLRAAHYASPEEISGQVKDIRSDIFSLGASFYHMLTGAAPFDGKSAVEILGARLNKNLKSPRRFNLALSDAVCQVLERMLARDPDDRYQTPQELLEDLERLQEGSALFTERIDPERTCLLRYSRKPSSRILPSARRDETAAKAASLGRSPASRLRRRGRKSARPTPMSVARAQALQAGRYFALGLGTGVCIVAAMVSAYFYLVA